MANFFIQKTPDNKKILLFSDSNTTTADYPVLLHYIDGELKYTYTESNVPVTISGETFTPSSGVSALNYSSLLTTLGTFYVFEINSISTGVTVSELELLSNGIHKFTIIDASNLDTFVEIGIHINQDIQCCVAKKINKIRERAKGCDPEQVIEDVQKIFAIQESINASLSELEFLEAVLKRNFILAICNGNCKCGCS